MELFKVVKSGVADDGRHIQIVFETDAGEATIEANASALEAIVGELSRLTGKARELRGGETIVPAIEPAAYAAKATKDKRFVMLGLRMENGLDQRFAFAVPDAEVLLARIGDAVADCKKS